MSWNYKLTKKQIEALRFLKKNNGCVHQDIADKNIHWLVQNNLYIKLLTSNYANGIGGTMELTTRGYDALKTKP